MNVWKQTNRFWKKWIEREESKSADQNMREQELIFWLILASIGNFAEDFGSEDLKKAGKCLKYVRNTEKADISEVLQFAFECVYQIIKNDKNGTFMKYFGGSIIAGLMSFINRFEYVECDVKKRVKVYLEELFNVPEKYFSTYGSSTMLAVIHLHSIRTWKQLSEEDRENGNISADNRFIVRSLDNIWPQFKGEYFIGQKYFKACYGPKYEEDLISWEEIVINGFDLDVNIFIAEEFLNLYSYAMTYGSWNYFFYWETRVYFDLIFHLLRCDDISHDEHERAVKQLGEIWEEYNKPKKAGRKKQQKDEVMEEDEIKERNGCVKRLLDRRLEFLKDFVEILSYEEKYICLYWKLVFEIWRKNKIRVHSNVTSYFLEIKEPKELKIESDNCISWKGEVDKESLIIYLFIRSRCM